MNFEQKKSLINSAVEKNNIPRVLYKYRSMDQAKMFLQNFQFWFSKPTEFNDPFDCALSECPNPSSDDLRKYLEWRQLPVSDIDKMVAMSERTPGFLIKNIEDVKNRTIRAKGVFCLSEKYDNILMWSHYAESHKGVVFGLDVQTDLGFFVMPIRVNYQDSYEELNFLNNPLKSTEDTLKIKSSQWAYEKELRIYKNEFGLHEINKNAVKEIYFGIKTSDDDVENFKSICREKGLSDVKFFKGYKAHAAFGVTFSQI